MTTTYPSLTHQWCSSHKMTTFFQISDHLHKQLRTQKCSHRRAPKLQKCQLDALQHDFMTKSSWWISLLVDHNVETCRVMPCKAPSDDQVKLDPFRYIHQAKCYVLLGVKLNSLATYGSVSIPRPSIQTLCCLRSTQQLQQKMTSKCAHHMKKMLPFTT